jgi:hypothetical protein
MAFVDTGTALTRRSRLIVITVGAISTIIGSVVFIIIMAPYQGPPRQDAPWILGYMSAYTALGSIGVIIGIWILVRVVNNVIWS